MFVEGLASTQIPSRIVSTDLRRACANANSTSTSDPSPSSLAPRGSRVACSESANHHVSFKVSLKD
eukprot:975059-Rhodomonas_salina.2